MKLTVISPSHFDPREYSVIDALFAAGLERYDVRKPEASALELEAWISLIPEKWRSRLMLHTHHEFVAQFGLAGCHYRGTDRPRRSESSSGKGYTSHTCHDLPTLRAALGYYDSVFVSSMFPRNNGPTSALPDGRLRALLSARTTAQRRTTVFALGGVTAATIPHCSSLGFDGIAVKSAVWRSDDPIRAFRQIKKALPAAGT
jgi:thiamine-phosphate pyrophosphorylase